ncbi:glycosyltransferase family 87 protein [Nakamurella endophytica]|uniref:DUF2029 domain-containing protein n=1 Tax=Nakamurella endophytica TaxID=1748367 RepID=A0A917WHU4_9ACTN|nr:glycosyltransferase family 87 protein [Nakamurella endophytica]GGM06066.1 hypothetical protein GCM10011594_27760 [Nakamurella endophytica]
MITALSWIVLAACTVALLVLGRSRTAVPLGVSVLVGAVLRIGYAALTSRRYTPNDVASYFQSTGRLVLEGRDPVHDLPHRQWNFLELMPWVHAAELQTGLPWVYAVKIAPILCDLVVIVLVARLARSDGPARALQYAVNPLSLLVVSLHGQVEPVALALALGAVVLLRRRWPVLAGVLLGAAVAAKTWPVVILVAVLPLRRPVVALRILVGAAVVPVLCLLSGVLFLDTDPVHDVLHMTSYSSYVSLWTWSAVVIQTVDVKGGYDSPVGSVGSLLLLAGVAVTLYLLRRRPPEVRAFGVLCAALICTAGFSTQYLMWVLPWAFLLSGPVRLWFVAASTAWGAVFYLHPFPEYEQYLRGMSWLPWALLVLLLVEQVRQARVAEVAGAPLGADRPDGARTADPDAVRAETPAGVGPGSAAAEAASGSDRGAPRSRDADPVTAPLALRPPP